MSQISLDQAAVYTKLCELDALKKLVAEQAKTIEELKERIIKLEADAGVTKTGLNEIGNALELRGILKNGEAVEASEKGEPWDPQKIKWTSAEGSKGEYERSEDVDNSDFKKMLQDLGTHKGKLHRNGLFYWIFTNGAVVGRKRRGKS
jgi:hypothetical protein